MSTFGGGQSCLVSWQCRLSRWSELVCYAYGAVLDRLGHSGSKLLEQTGLSERDLEDPETIRPAHQAWRFIGSGGQSEGVDDLGLIPGDMPIVDFGQFSRRLVQVANLNQAMEAFCRLAISILMPISTCRDRNRRPGSVGALSTATKLKRSMWNFWSSR